MGDENRQLVRYEQSIERHYHEPVNPHESNRLIDGLIAFFVLSFLAMVVVGAIYAHQTLVQAGILFFYGILVLIPLVIGGLIGYLFWHKWYIDKQKRKHAALDVQAKEEQVQREKEKHEVEMYLAQTRLYADPNGNRPHIFNPKTFEILEIASGNYQQPVPNHFAPHFHDTSTKVAEEKVNTPSPLLLPDKVLMLDVMRKWDLTPDNLFLALGKGHQEIACTLEDLMHVAHDAPTGGGKTAQFYAEIIMLLKLGVRVILANPHFAPLGKKGEDWRPIGKCIEAQGMIEIAPDVHVPGLLRNYTTIANMLKWLAESEIDRRFTLQAQGDYGYEPIYIFVDEWPAVVRRHPEAAEYQVDVLQRGRAVEVCIDTNAQGFLNEDVALKGSARENFNTAYHMGGSVHSGSRLLDMPIRDMNKLFQVEQVALGKGIALLRNNIAAPQAQLVRLPFAENTYCYYMLGKADNWQLPEFRNVSRNFRTDELNRNISDDFRNTVKSDIEPVESDNPKFQEETNVKHKIDVSLEIRNEIVRLRKRGFNRTEIRDAMGFNGEQFKMIKQTLDEEGL